MRVGARIGASVSGVRGLAGRLHEYELVWTRTTGVEPFPLAVLQQRCRTVHEAIVYGYS